MTFYGKKKECIGGDWAKGNLGKADISATVANHDSLKEKPIITQQHHELY